MEWYTTVDGKYRIEYLSAATFQGALRVIKESFCQEESVCIGTEINKNEEAAEELLELCADSALDGVSLVAVHIERGEVVSTLFNKLQVAKTDPTKKTFFETFAAERCKHPSSRSLIEFMADADEKCDFFGKLGADCSLEMMFLATLKAHRNKKLAKILCKTSLELAKKLKEGPVSTMRVKDLGPKYAFMSDRIVSCVPKFCQALFTAKASQKIGNALGFTVHVYIPFTEYSFKGKTYKERLGTDVVCDGAAIGL